MNNYLQDGAGNQAKAVLAFLQGRNIENSWSDNFNEYSAKVNIARWENGREQGYVIWLQNKMATKQMNIAFFEHRIGDTIVAWAWVKDTYGSSPTIKDYPEDDCDLGSINLNYGEASKMADQIWEQATIFWSTK